MEHVAWQEFRGGELFFVEADKTPTGWTFSERSTYAVRWFSVSPKSGWIEKAERLMKKSTRNTDSRDHLDGELPEVMAAPDVGVGNFYDNASVLAVAKWKINIGAVREGLLMLNMLQAHIVAMADQKSRRILLPAVEEAIHLGYLRQVEHRRAAEKAEVRRPQVHAIDRQAMAGDGEVNHSSSDNVSQFKLRLIDVVGLVMALCWTHSLLVHEIMTLPGLATRPTGANVVAGSVLASVLYFLSRTGRLGPPMALRCSEPKGRDEGVYFESAPPTATQLFDAKSTIEST